jgi:hypothetical protein
MRTITARKSCRVALLLAICQLAHGQWQPVAPGIDYAEFTVAGPNNVFAARMDRSDPNCTIDSMLGQSRLTGGTETTSSMASKNEDAIGYWGQYWGDRYDVIVAINGDFYSSGQSVSGQIASGWYAKRFPDFTGGSGFAWQLDRDAFIGECVRHMASKQKVAYPATGQSQNINGVNEARGSDELILYTHHRDATTGTDDYGTEVLVQMARPTLVLPTPAHATGIVVEIHENQGSTPIPFDCIVLSGHGSAATKLLSNVSIGAEVRISQEITHYEHDCSTPLGWDWTKTYASIGGSYHFLKNGVVQTFTDPGATARHPRTAIAFNDDYIFFVVVDGRSAESVGMDMTELGNFCLTDLGAIEGLNQDGGGSSTLWVDGAVMNVPSDGSERPVANGMMMVRVKPMASSSRFTAGAAVRTVGNTPVRAGPGANYTAFGTAPNQTDGFVLDHAFNGIEATGSNWWLCDFATWRGWVQETSLMEGGCVGDYNANGAIDGGDVPNLFFCWAGPDYQFVPGTFCTEGDSDDDLDVDLVDVHVFQTCFSGP